MTPQAAEDQKAKSPRRAEAPEAKDPKATDAKKPTTAKWAKTPKTTKEATNAKKPATVNRTKTAKTTKTTKKAAKAKMKDTTKGAKTSKISAAKTATMAKKPPTKKVGMTCETNCANPENFPFDRGKKKGSDSPIQTFIIPILDI